jgi:hypothetical protein
MKRLFAPGAVCLLLAACATNAPPPTVPIPAAPRTGEPDDLIGLSGPQLRAIFGAPALLRQDGIAELWRYDGTGCHAFFFLYDKDGHKQVRHVETLPRGTVMAADDKCLSALRLSPKTS